MHMGVIDDQFSQSMKANIHSMVVLYSHKGEGIVIAFQHTAVICHTYYIVHMAKYVHVMHFGHNRGKFITR